MTVPRIFATQAAGNVPASYLDEDFAECALLDANNALTGINSVIGNNASAITTDGAQITIQNSATTASSIYTPISGAGTHYWEATRSVLVSPTGGTTIDSAAFGSYVLNNGAIVGSVGAASGNFMIGISAVDNAATWGNSTGLLDSAVNAAGSGTGRGLNGHEFDFTIYNNGTTVEGTVLLLGGLAQPQSASGFSVNSGGTDHLTMLPIKWKESFVSFNGASLVAMQVGAVDISGTNVASQPINFHGFDGTSAGYFSQLSMNNRSFLLTDATNVNGFEFDTAPTLNSPTIAAFGTDTDITLRLSGKGAGTVVSLTPLVGPRIETTKYFQSSIPRTITGSTDSPTDTDNYLIANHAGTLTLTLPDPTSAAQGGRMIRIKTIQNQTVVSATSNIVPLIGGSASTAILAATAGKWADLVADGAAWQIMAGN